MQNFKLRILLWAPFGAGMHYWGPGTNAFRLYKHAIQFGNISVDLAHGSIFQGEFPEVYRNQYMLEDISLHKKLALLKFYYKSNNFLEKHGKEFDVFHGIGGFHTTFNAAIRATEIGLPSFIKMTGINGGFGNNSFLSKILGFEKSRKRNANRITGYIAISNAIKDNLLAHGIHEERIHLIPNGVNMEVFHPVSKTSKEQIRRQLNIPDKITFIYVGGLTLNKRQHICVESVLKLVREGFDLQLLIIGPDRNNGIELSNIYSVLNKYPDLRDRIIFIDHTNQPNLYYQASDYFFLISGYEGMPNSLLEAMSVGLPPIVTKIPGIVDIVEDGKSGVFVEPNSDDVIEKVKKLLICSDTFGTLSRGAFKKIEDNFSSNIVWNKHLELFKRFV